MKPSDQAAEFPGLFKRQPGRIRPELEGLRAALDVLENPERDYPSMLVVGTNGKGSTVAMLSSILDAAGLRVGRFTSPHLIDVRERITISSEKIPLPDFREGLVYAGAFPGLTFFETLSLVAFRYFSREKVDCVILEAGMGGRWDATRAAGSEVAGLSSLGMDHQRWLGRTPEAVAADKGAALRSAASAILAPCVPEYLLPAINAPEARWASEYLSVETERNEESCAVVFPGRPELFLPLPLQGEHQLSNLHLALAMIKAGSRMGWYPPVGNEVLLRGLSSCRWPGRLETVSIGGRAVLLDGAHNLEAARALAHELGKEKRRRNLLFSCLADKPVQEIASILRPLTKDVVICPLNDERAMSLEELQTAWPEARPAGDPLEGLHLLHDPVVAAGSLRLVGALLAHADAAKGA